MCLLSRWQPGSGLLAALLLDTVRLGAAAGMTGTSTEGACGLLRHAVSWAACSSSLQALLPGCRAVPAHCAGCAASLAGCIVGRVSAVCASNCQTTVLLLVLTLCLTTAGRRRMPPRTASTMTGWSVSASCCILLFAAVLGCSALACCGNISIPPACSVTMIACSADLWYPCPAGTYLSCLLGLCIDAGCAMPCAELGAATAHQGFCGDRSAAPMPMLASQVMRWLTRLESALHKATVGLGQMSLAPSSCQQWHCAETNAAAAADKLEDALRKAGMELVPKSLPSGTDLLEMGPGPQHGFRETCNGRPVWAHGYLPCWGKFEVHAEMHGNEVMASCQVGALHNSSHVVPTQWTALHCLHWPAPATPDHCCCVPRLGSPSRPGGRP